VPAIQKYTECYLQTKNCRKYQAS